LTDRVESGKLGGPEQTFLSKLLATDVVGPKNKCTIQALEIIHSMLSGIGSGENAKKDARESTKFISWLWLPGVILSSSTCIHKSQMLF
jgi:hypothetical protein